MRWFPGNNPRLTWHWAGWRHRRAQAALGRFPRYCCYQASLSPERKTAMSVIQTHPDTRDCLHLRAWHGQWSRSRLNMVPPCFGSQACLVGISFVSINSGSPNTSILDLTRPRPHGILSHVPSTPNCISEPGHESHHSDHTHSLARPGQQPGWREGGNKPRSEFYRSSHWKSQICWSLNQEQDSTLTLQLYVCAWCADCWWLIGILRRRNLDIWHIYSNRIKIAAVHTLK